MKSKLLIALILFSSLASAQIDQGLLLHYKFDGNANDSSGNARHGTNFGGTYGQDRHENPNSAIYLDGEDDYVNFPNLAELKPQLPVSFSFWVRYDSTSYQDQTVFNTSFEENRCTGIWFNSTASTSKPAVNYGNGEFAYNPDTRRTIVTDTVIDTNNWYQMIVIVKAFDDMVIYVNCKDYGKVYSGSAAELVYSNTPGCIGRHDRDLSLPPDYFKGFIDDFYYWNRELTFNEIFELCNPPELNVPEYSFDYFTVSPNPAHSILNLSTNISGSKRIRMYNATGQEVMNTDFAETVDVSNYPTGLYFITLYDGVKNINKKIVIH